MAGVVASLSHSARRRRSQILVDAAHSAGRALCGTDGWPLAPEGRFQSPFHPQTHTPDTIADKHIRISLKVKETAEKTRPHDDVFVATFRAGANGHAYQRIEQESGAEFWSIKAWTPLPPPRRRLKDPVSNEPICQPRKSRGSLDPALFAGARGMSQ